jgi:phage repressor protein C with HTH and peptisase S24 domain
MPSATAPAAAAGLPDADTACRLARWVRVTDDTMEPRYSSGERLLVEIDTEPPPGGDIVFETARGPFLRNLMASDERTITVRQYQPPMLTTLIRADVAAIHRVIPADE